MKRKRRRPLLLTPALTLLLHNHHPTTTAIIARPLPFRDVDSNGHLSPPIYLRGDESFHWEEDVHGYTLIDDPDYISVKGRRRRVYADLDQGGNLISSGIVFGSAKMNKIQRKRLGRLKKHIKPPERIRRWKCGRYCESGLYNQTSRLDSASSLPYDNRRNREEHANRRILLSDNQTSSLKNLAVLIRFANHQQRILPSPSDYEILLNGPGGVGTVAPTGSVNDVFLANSYGKFRLDSTVVPWITVSESEEYYADGKSGLSSKIFEAIREAMDVIDADPTINLEDFNTNYDSGDRYIDSITIFHSGYGAEWGGSDCYGTPENKRIWSHNWFLYDGEWKSSDGKVKVSGYNINPGVWDICGSKISRIGVVAHEASHFLGLPDLYDPDGSGYGVGIYCLMSDSWGADVSQLYPPLMSPWSKMYLGWLTPTVITGKGDKKLKQSWEYPDALALIQGYQSGEYLLIENRQPGSFDALLPSGGLAIWHIDEFMAETGNSEEGFPGMFGWPANNKHYHVALLQADGRYDLERGINSGDDLDLFRFDFFRPGGVDFLYPSYNDPKSGPFPNTDTYGRGIVKRTNHYISGISASGPEMQLSVLTSSPCQQDEVHFDLLLLTDGKGSEVGWSLRETSTDEVLLAGKNYSSYKQINVVQCLPANCYTFLIADTGGDGLCCDYGRGGYIVRLNALKMAAGSQFGSQDEVNLQCLMTPTGSPTTTSRPSSNPSDLPSMSPTNENCTGRKMLLEVISEGEEFVNEISWNVQDIHGNLVLESTFNDGGHQTTYDCIPRDACYTFTIHDSVGVSTVESGQHRGLYTIKLDDEVVLSGSNFHTNRHVMFGDSCLASGDSACSSSSELSSLFRLEFAGDNLGGNVTWQLIDSTDATIIRSAGPFGKCDVNTLATCIPRAGCYEFITTNTASNSAESAGLFTVLFSEMNDMIQNVSSYFSHGATKVFLGSCYDRNFI